MVITDDRPCSICLEGMGATPTADARTRRVRYDDDETGRRPTSAVAESIMHDVASDDRELAVKKRLRQVQQVALYQVETLRDRALVWGRRSGTTATSSRW